MKKESHLKKIVHFLSIRSLGNSIELMKGKFELSQKEKLLISKDLSLRLLVCGIGLKGPLHCIVSSRQKLSPLSSL